METVLGAILATAVELVVLALIIAPRWTVRKIASLGQSTTSPPRSNTLDEHAI
jgi:hypothetical protein